MKMKPIAAQLRQRHLEQQALSWSQVPCWTACLPFCIHAPLVRRATKNVIMILQKLYFGHCVFSVILIILPQRIGSHNYDINLWSLPESATCPRGSLGRAEGKLSAVHSRRVMAGWPNCLFLLSEWAGKPSISLIITEGHWLPCLNRSYSTKWSWATPVSNKSIPNMPVLLCSGSITHNLMPWTLILDKRVLSKFILSDIFVSNRWNSGYLSITSVLHQ